MSKITVQNTNITSEFGSSYIIPILNPPNSRGLGLMKLNQIAIHQISVLESNDYAGKLLK